jgi:hypothetical protein
MRRKRLRIMNVRVIVIFLIFVLLGGTRVRADGEKKGVWLYAAQEATVAIGTLKRATVTRGAGPSIEKDIFAVIGTGVILANPWAPSKRPWLVTAKHVFYQPEKKWEPESVQIRFSWFDDRPVYEYLGVRVQLIEGSERLWTPHPNDDTDLAGIPLNVEVSEAGRKIVPVIPFGNFASMDDVFGGASVVVLGYPGAVGPYFLTRALMRRGIIAWVDPHDPLEKPLLIDAMIFPGNSGGPVLKIPFGIRQDGNFDVGGRAAFLGIVTQTKGQYFPVLEKNGNEPIKIIGEKGPIEIVSPHLVGIGLVEPASRVRELLRSALGTD